MPLGADDVQAAHLGDLAALLLHLLLGLDLLDRLLPDVFGHFEPRRVAAVVVLECFSRAQASVSGLPPRMMSVPRPAMFVAMVTAPMRPAWATISASRADVLRLGVEQLVLDAAPLEHARELLDLSTSVVPTRIGRPVSWTSSISSTTASHFSFSVR